MKIYINPKYEHLRDYLVHIDEHFEHEGCDLHHDRNVVRVLRAGGMLLCVKHYGRTSWRNGVAVRICKASKGRQAYIRAAELRERGFESQEPVAYVAYRKSLLKQSMFFVCRFEGEGHSLTEAKQLPEAEQQALATAFAHFMARLHSDGFLHHGFLTDTVLYAACDGHFRFSLLDTNNLRRRRRVSAETGCRNMSTLSGSKAFLDTFVMAYAEARKVSVEGCRRAFFSPRQAAR